VGEVEVAGGGTGLDPLWMDDSRIWVATDGASIKAIGLHISGSFIEGWDFGILGSSPIPLSNAFPDRPHLDLIDSNIWDPGPAVIKDALTGKEVFQLVGTDTKPPRIQWDGQYLVAGYMSGEVLILDFNHIVPE